MMRSDELTAVPVAGEIWHDAPVGRPAAGEMVWLPHVSIGSADLVFRARSPVREQRIEPGDLLVVEPRDGDDARNGELVIVITGERAFIGHWWAKHGMRVLLDNSGVITRDKTMQLVGAITVIVRANA
jgi:hypothetical protein